MEKSWACYGVAVVGTIYCVELEVLFSDERSEDFAMDEGEVGLVVFSDAGKVSSCFGWDDDCELVFDGVV